MARYRKKPVEVEAWQVGSDEPMPVWFWEAYHDGVVRPVDKLISKSGCIIKTLEGDMTASIGDFVIRGVKGELYPCKPDIFEQTYEVVE